MFFVIGNERIFLIFLFTKPPAAASPNLMRFLWQLKLQKKFSPVNILYPYTLQG